MIIIIIIVKNKSDYRATMGIFVILVVFEIIYEINELRIKNFRNSTKEINKSNSQNDNQIQISSSTQK
jgi:hypothetical protein